jgi:hypothetical protein
MRLSLSVCCHWSFTIHQLLHIMITRFLLKVQRFIQTFQIYFIIIQPETIPTEERSQSHQIQDKALRMVQIYIYVLAVVVRGYRQIFSSTSEHFPYHC